MSYDCEMKTDLRILSRVELAALSGFDVSVENLAVATGANLPLNTTPSTPLDCLNAIEVIIMIIIVLNSLFFLLNALELCINITCLGRGFVLLTHNITSFILLHNLEFSHSTGRDDGECNYNSYFFLRL